MKVAIEWTRYIFAEKVKNNDRVLLAAGKKSWAACCAIAEKNVLQTSPRQQTEMQKRRCYIFFMYTVVPSLVILKKYLPQSCWIQRDTICQQPNTVDFFTTLKLENLVHKFVLMNYKKNSRSSILQVLQLWKRA